MQIDRIAAVMRPRDHWEALDLGLRMVRTWWRSIYPPLILAVLGLWLLLLFLTPSVPWLSPLILWWLKPWWDRIPLLILSRRMFGETLSTRQALGAFWDSLKHDGLASITWLRFSFFRHVTMPVSVLEESPRGLKNRRKAALVHPILGLTFTTMLIFMVFEWLVFFFGWFVLVAIMVPQEWAGEFFPVMDPVPEMALYTGVWLVGAIFLEPFFVAAGFSLYLNRRAQAEAWDLELALKQMARRLGQMALTGLVIFWALALSTAHSMAATEWQPSQPQDAGREILKIMREPEFSENVQDYRLVSRFKKKKERSEPLYSSPRFMPWDGFLGRIFLVILIAGLVFALIMLVRSVQRGGPMAGSAVRSPGSTAIRTGLAQALLRESLPEDIVAAAQTAWRRGEHRLGVSLLYRGAIREWDKRGAFHLGDFATEGECSALITKHVGGEPAAYFGRLTRAWIAIAYGERVPADEAFQELCGHWHDQVRTAS